MGTPIFVTYGRVIFIKGPEVNGTVVRDRILYRGFVSDFSNSRPRLTCIHISVPWVLHATRPLLRQPRQQTSTWDNDGSRRKT
jgi:hypothetical protein